eukprot:4348784-Amphidinium_carterae.1
MVSCPLLVSKVPSHQYASNSLLQALAGKRAIQKALRGIEGFAALPRMGRHATQRDASKDPI